MNRAENDIITTLSGVSPEKINDWAFYKDLVKDLNNLINENFNFFISLLYRLDIDEEKFKLLLKKFPEKDAAEIAAVLIIERELQKRKTRRQFRHDDNISEDDKW